MPTHQPTPTTLPNLHLQHQGQPMTEQKRFLPYPRRDLIAMGRCPDCGFHPETQGHNTDCPTHPPGDERGAM